MNRSFMFRSQIILFFLLFFTCMASAEVSFVMDGFYWVRGKWLHEADVDKSRDPQDARYFQHRMKFMPQLTNKRMSLFAHFIGFEDEIWGAKGGDILTQSTSEVTRNWTIQRLWGEVRFSFGLIRVGRMPSHWGMGIVANNGDNFDDAFGDKHFGDTADRILFATRPLGADSHLVIALGIGQVVEDAYPLDRRRGEYDGEDDVLDGLFVLLYDTDPLKSGIYIVYRTQDNTRSKIWILDYYGQIKKWNAFLTTEIAYFLGESNYFNDPGNMGVKDVRQGGGVIRMGREFGRLVPSLELGLASGDGNLNNDPRIENFYFNPDYNVGFILFEEVMAGRTREVVDEIKMNTAELPAAARYFSTLGKVTNTLYAYPMLTYNYGENSRLRLGLLWARALSDMIDPFQTQTSVMGGTNVGLRGADPKARDLGYEIDLGLEQGIGDNVRLGFQAGYLIPGDVFDKGDGTGIKTGGADDVIKFVGRFTFVF